MTEQDIQEIQYILRNYDVPDEVISEILAKLYHSVKLKQVTSQRPESGEARITVRGHRFGVGTAPSI